MPARSHSCPLCFVPIIELQIDIDCISVIINSLW
jgi:hypothetical protein